MQTEKELHFTATRFLEIAESYLRQTEKVFGMSVDVVLPMNQSNFTRTLEALKLINKLGKEKNIVVEVEDESEALNEYGHTCCFKLKKIND